MANNKELELTIKIAGKMDKSLTSALNSTQKGISGLAKGLSKIGTVGLAAMGALGVGAVKFISDATNKAQEFEQQMADVVKYVDGLADSMGQISNKVDAETGRTYAENYDLMKKAIMDLSAQIPYTREELTKLAAAAGQSGYSIAELIQYDQNGQIQGFLKDVAMWGTAMDVDAEQAGNWAAKWEKAFSMTHSEVMEMADVINYLGANSATTAAEIASAVNSAASLGQIAGIDVKTTAALADAMLATGVSANRVGTSLKRIYTNMSKGESATKAQQAAWQELGFSAEQIAKSMQTDGAGTMLKVFEAIKEMPSERQVATLSQLFGNWAIEGAGKIVGNLSTYTDALKMVQDPSLYGGSMEREFIIKASTGESIKQMLGSSIENLQIAIGDAFLPVKKQFLLTLLDITNGLRANAPEIQEIAQSLANVLGKGLERLGNAIKDALPKIRQMLDYLNNHGDTVVKVIGGLAAAFTGMKFAPLVNTLANAGSGLLGMGSKAGKSGGGLLANLFGKGKAAGSNLANIFTKGSQLGKAQGSRSMGILGVMQNFGSIFSGNSKVAAGGMAAAGQSMANGGSLLGMLKNMITGSKVGQAAAGGMSMLSGIGGAFSSGGLGAGISAIGSSLAPLAAGLGGVVTGALPIVGIFSAIVASGSLLYDNLDGIRGIIGNTFGETGLAIFDSFKSKLDEVLGFIDKITHGGLADALSGIREGFVGLFSGDAATLAGETFDAVTNVAQGILNVVGQVVDFANTYVKPIISEIFDFIVNNVLPTILSTFNAVAPAIQSAIESIGSVIMSIASVIASAIQALLPIFEGIIDVIMHIAQVVIPFLGNIVSTVFGAISTVVQAIGQVFQGVFSAIGGIIDGICAAFQGMADIIAGVFSGLVEIVKAPINAVISLVNMAIRAINGIGITIPDWVPGIGGARLGFSIPEIPMLAKGGFTDGPSIAGEAGREAVISFDKSVRAQNLSTWAAAGEMLGARELTPFNGDFSGSAGNMTFSPNITINGNADPDVVDGMVNQMQAMFENWYEQKQRLQGRTAY